MTQEDLDEIRAIVRDELEKHDKEIYAKRIESEDEWWENVRDMQRPSQPFSETLSGR